MIKQWLISLGAVLSTIMVIFTAGKRRGKQDMEAKQNERILDNVAKAKQIQDDVGAMSDDTKRNELFKDWQSK